AGEMHAPAVDVEMLVEMAQDLTHIGFSEAATPGATRSTQDRGFEVAGVWLHVERVLQVVCGVRVHPESQGRGFLRTVVAGYVKLEGLPGPIDRRQIGPLMDAAELTEQLRIVEDAL